MTEKFKKGEFLYMELTTWLLEHFKDVYDDYQLNAAEAHIQKWRKYIKGDKE
tara:strand:+ start:770 stop:925 length:156 start_codon:yes stop_codon:yes gene_type:complete